MTTVTDNDIYQINQRLDQIVNALGQVNTKLTDLEKNQIKLEGKIESLDTKLEGKLESLEAELKGDIKAQCENLNGKITTINETVKGVEKRLDNIEILNRIIFGAVIGSVFVGLIKYLFFSNPNI